MYKKLIIFFAFFIVSSVYAKEPCNIHFNKQELTHYYESGEYISDINRVILAARNCLKNSIEDNYKKGNKKLALILDIDDTAITVVKYGNKLSFGLTSEEFKALARKANIKPLKPTLDMYNFIRSQGVSVFFVSGRPQELLEATVNNLKYAGYKDWDGIYLRPDNYNDTYKTIVPFKAGIRRMLQLKGYTIIGNIGDQKSDLAGGDKVVCSFKLPNPYYFIN